MRIPGESREEFVLLMPFTPLRRDNMIAWLAARSDGPAYGRLVAFLFPKQRLVFGPRQIGARIDQDAVISQQITLWSQRGSTVLRGSLLAIPVEDSLLYVQPLYLAAEKGSIPELKRVIVAHGNQIAMSETLDSALQTIFAGRPGVSVSRTAETGPTAAPGEGITGLVGRAWEAWTRAQDALRRGDWGAYGEAQHRVEEALRALREHAPR